MKKVADAGLSDDQTKKLKDAAEAAKEKLLSDGSREVFQKVVGELFKQFQAAGQSSETAQANAKRFAAEHVRRLTQKKKPLEELANPLRGLFPEDPSS